MILLVTLITARADAQVDYVRDVRPILEKHCYECHGAKARKSSYRLDRRDIALKGGDIGEAAIVALDSKSSPLIRYVNGEDETILMPPKESGKPRLSTADVKMLRTWIDEGAAWPDEFSGIAKDGTLHWSLTPLVMPAVPDNDANPIDAFTRARLNEKNLTLSPEADRRTLIRRTTFDLIGLPPTPDEIDAFLVDSSPGAFAVVVDRLLASPQYGERWARHWLDVARFTESQGFEYDRLRENAWHYRDYVIKSFNQDKPYDQFMKEQVAGDVLDPVTSDGIVAASLLVCGAWDQAGNAQKNATQRAISREDELEDLIGVVGQSFLGLTINCARCHAHKFDPIPHEEYYRIKSVFEGVKHGERSIADTSDAKNSPKPPEPVPGGVSYAGIRVQPAPTRLLRRGDVNLPDAVITPGALSAVVDLDPDFGLSADAPEAQRRLKFAAWLADARNPLPARVMTNRVWHLHFGQGLVATPNDFGVSGARPSHPELLDWLAVKFIESGWSVKALHRLIMNSATYRQSATFNDAAAAVDADNQLLWRFSPRRLEAEAVRDAMLSVSGQINLKIGGPGFRPFTITEFNAAFYTIIDREEPEFNRRTIYRMNVNSGKDPLLDSFDCPDPSVKTPRRGVTTTPLQALELMNNSFVQRQANHFAERAMKSAGDDRNAGIRTAYLLAIGRGPTTDEFTRAAAAARERGLHSVCWALLNSTEFIYVR